MTDCLLVPIRLESHQTLQFETGGSIKIIWCGCGVAKSLYYSEEKSVLKVDDSIFFTIRKNYFLWLLEWEDGSEIEHKINHIVQMLAFRRREEGFDR